MKMTGQIEDTQPCPFCGSDTPPTVLSGGTCVFTSCEDCGARGPEIRRPGSYRFRDDPISAEDKNAALNEWNRRTNAEGHTGD